jgi:hypothetical protein
MQRYCSVPDTLIHWYHHHLESRQLDISDLFGQATLRPVLRLLKPSLIEMKTSKPSQARFKMFDNPKAETSPKWGLEIER